MFKNGCRLITLIGKVFCWTLSGISEIMASHWIDVQVAPGAEKPPGASLFGDRENDVAYVGVERGDKRMRACTP